MPKKPTDADLAIRIWEYLERHGLSRGSRMITPSEIPGHEKKDPEWSPVFAIIASGRLADLHYGTLSTTGDSFSPNSFYHTKEQRDFYRYAKRIGLHYTLGPRFSASPMSGLELYFYRPTKKQFAGRSYWVGPD